MGILDSLLIASHPFYCHIFLPLGQELCSRGKIGHEDEYHNTPDDADTAEDEEYIHPAGEGAGSYVSNCVTEEATDHGCNAVGAVICFETEGLFGGSPPHACRE